MDGDHPCAASGCLKRVDHDKLMCVPHWKQLPADIQSEVWATWRNIHRDRQAYFDAREKAVKWHRNNGTGRQGGLFL